MNLRQLKEIVEQLFQIVKIRYKEKITEDLRKEQISEALVMGITRGMDSELRDNKIWIEITEGDTGKKDQQIQK